MPSTYVYAACAVAALFIVQRIVEFRRVLARVGGMPGLRLLFNFYIPLPTKYIPGVYVNWGHYADKKYDSEFALQCCYYAETCSLQRVWHGNVLRGVLHRSLLLDMMSQRGSDIVLPCDDEHGAHRRSAHDQGQPLRHIRRNLFAPSSQILLRQEITTARSRFPKPVEIYRLLSFYGPNIVATEGDDWKVCVLP